MSPSEMAWRVHDEALHRAWRRRQIPHGSPPPELDALDGVDVRRHRFFPSTLPASSVPELFPELGHRLAAAADEILAGRFELLGVERNDLVNPDWFFDPVTGRRAPDSTYSFAIDHRSEEVTGNVKQVWELSRHHHLTVLAAATAVGARDCRETIERHLQSWWELNPYLSGVNWTSGIELGVRLISWVWTRRLLGESPATVALFEENPLAVAQVAWHQQYLATFQSRGSSANNHVIAEAAGQLIASLAFPWFDESDEWAERSATLLETEFEHNTFPSGLNREQASNYHGLVAELGLLAAVEADVAGRPLGDATWERLAAMFDAAAAVVDETGRPPRQGDGDDGRGLLVDPPSVTPWTSLLATGGALVGRLGWWPEAPESAMSALVGAFAQTSARSRELGARPPMRPDHFPDAGCTILRSGTRASASPAASAGPAANAGPELWCRCDGGPHGFLSIAAHGHADALSVEVRYGGVDILADPGTFCYHGDPEWRRYFRSTIGHNALELAGEDQSVSGGPFLWLETAETTGGGLAFDPATGRQSWSASHDGYTRLSPPARHTRRVELDGAAGLLAIADEVRTDGEHAVRLAFHLGPAVTAELEGRVARLSWERDGSVEHAVFELPGALSWSAHRGEARPVMGWYSEGFGKKEPATTLLGIGRTHSGVTEFASALRFLAND
jgi:hypothetical protein